MTRSHNVNNTLEFVVVAVRGDVVTTEGRAGKMCECVCGFYLSAYKRKIPRFSKVCLYFGWFFQHVSFD